MYSVQNFMFFMFPLDIELGKYIVKIYDTHMRYCPLFLVWAEFHAFKKDFEVKITVIPTPENNSIYQHSNDVFR